MGGSVVLVVVESVGDPGPAREVWGLPEAGLVLVVVGLGEAGLVVAEGVGWVVDAVGHIQAWQPHHHLK